MRVTTTNRRGTDRQHYLRMQRLMTDTSPLLLVGLFYALLGLLVFLLYRIADLYRDS